MMPPIGQFGAGAAGAKCFGRTGFPAPQQNFAGIAGSFFRPAGLNVLFRFLNLLLAKNNKAVFLCIGKRPRALVRGYCVYLGRVAGAGEGVNCGAGVGMFCSKRFCMVLLPVLRLTGL